MKTAKKSKQLIDTDIADLCGADSLDDIAPAIGMIDADTSDALEDRGYIRYLRGQLYFTGAKGLIESIDTPELDSIDEARSVAAQIYRDRVWRYEATANGKRKIEMTF